MIARLMNSVLVCVFSLMCMLFAAQTVMDNAKTWTHVSDALSVVYENTSHGHASSGYRSGIQLVTLDGSAASKFAIRYAPADDSMTGTYAKHSPKRDNEKAARGQAPSGYGSGIQLVTLDGSAASRFAIRYPPADDSMTEASAKRSPEGDHEKAARGYAPSGHRSGIKLAALSDSSSDKMAKRYAPTDNSKAGTRAKRSPEGDHEKAARGYAPSGHRSGIKLAKLGGSVSGKMTMRYVTADNSKKGTHAKYSPKGGHEKAVLGYAPLGHSSGIKLAKLGGSVSGKTAMRHAVF